MHYAVVRLELRIPQSRSLKEKRAVLLHLKDRLRHRFHLSVIELEYQDLRQRAALGLALVALSESGARDAVLAIRREVEAEPRALVLETKTRFGRIEQDDAPDWASNVMTSSASRGDAESGRSEEQDDGEWTLGGFEEIEDAPDLTTDESGGKE